MTMLWVLVGTLLGFALVVGLILLWARGQVQRQKDQETGQMTRQAYLNLAAHAAGDASGRTLVKLLDALETAPADCPVIVSWNRHMPVGKPIGFLVKITWDGNEWRRVMDWDVFAAQIQSAAAESGPHGPRVQQLLADLEARP
jgi:hypothetical protein